MAEKKSPWPPNGIGTRLPRAMLVSNRKRGQGADNTSLTAEQKLGTFQYLLSLRPMFLSRLLRRCWREPLRDFICQLDVDSVGVLGAFASSKYTSCSNPIIRACWDRNKCLLEILLEMDLPVSVNNQDSYGSNPLHWAIERRNRECIALLLKRCASLTICNENVGAIHFPSFLPELCGNLR
jgi:ankyrin repeat protein